MRWSTLGLATLAVLGLLLVPGLTNGAAPGGPGRDEIVEERQPGPLVSGMRAQNRKALVEAVIQLSNVERAKAGLPPLRRNDDLVTAAQEYARVLAPGPCFEHTCPPVPALRDRLARVRYTDFERIGENIAAGDETAASVIGSWMSSPGHRANILKPEYKEIGVGVATGDGEYGIYWVQVFGARWE